ncbi:MAG: hypothetical protein ACYSR3_13895 [Planctomycetota bacterium]
MKTWNFCIIGAGLIADFHARAIKDIPKPSPKSFLSSHELIGRNLK